MRRVRYRKYTTSFWDHPRRPRPTTAPGGWVVDDDDSRPSNDTRYLTHYTQIQDTSFRLVKVDLGIESFLRLLRLLISGRTDLSHSVRPLSSLSQPLNNLQTSQCYPPTKLSSFCTRLTSFPVFLLFSFYPRSRSFLSGLCQLFRLFT